MDAVPAGEEEYHKIQQGGTDYHPGHNAAGKGGKYEQRRINDSQPFDLNGNDEHEKHLHLRKSCRICKEYRHIDIVSRKCPEIHGCSALKKIDGFCSERDGRCSGKQAVQKQEDAAQNRKEHTGKQVDIISVGSPDPFQLGTNGIIKYQRDQNEKYIGCIRRNDDPRDKPPDLSVHEYFKGIQCEVAKKGRIDDINQIPHRIADHQIEGKIRDRIPAELSFKFIGKTVSCHSINSFIRILCVILQTFYHPGPQK